MSARPEHGTRIPFRGGMLNGKTTTYMGVDRTLTTGGHGKQPPETLGDVYTLTSTSAGWEYVATGRETIAEYNAWWAENKPQPAAEVPA